MGIETTPGQQAQYFIPIHLTQLAPSADASPERREYGVSFVSAGRVRSRDGKQANWEIPAGTIREAIGLMNAKPVFVDHTTWLDDYPHMDRMAGVTFGATWNEQLQRVDGGIRMYDCPMGQCMTMIFDQVVADAGAGQEVPDVGLSLSFFGRHDFIDVGEEPGEEYMRITTEITHIESVDIVFGPGTADARIREILSSVTNGAAIAPPINILAQNGGVQMDKFCSKCGGALVSGQEHTCPVAQVDTQLAGSGLGQTPAAPAPTPQPAPVQALLPPAPADLAMQLSAVNARLDQLTAALASRIEPSVIQGMGHAPADRPENQRGGAYITGLNTWDQVELAYQRLMGMPVNQPVYQLNGVRELYLMLTGDRNFTGRYNADNVMVQLAYDPNGNNADTTAMAELTRNVMNKVLVEQVNLLEEYRWWQRIVKQENFTTLQQVEWVRIGGIGDLPTVAEKAEYTQLAWDDARTTADWVKKGGYLPLSLEMIDRDDLVGWRDVPRQLAWAAIVTLSSVISALFTDNAGAGPSITTEGITDNLFSAAFGNVITQPLDFTNWGLAVETMYKLAQLNVSGRRQGVRPKYLMVPIELEGQGIEAATTTIKPNTFTNKVARKRTIPEDNVITVPHWTDAESWAAVADPAMVPIAGVGFRFGELPELFTQADPRIGLLFTNDVLPIKVRYFFAVSAINPRGAIKSNQ